MGEAITNEQQVLKLRLPSELVVMYEDSRTHARCLQLCLKLEKIPSSHDLDWRDISRSAG